MITEQEKRDNLNKLADYLLSLPDDYKHFYMGQFHDYVLSNPDYSPEKTFSCGTSACAVGHGPNAGIGDYKSCSDWIEYSEKYLIADVYENSAWDWCFSESWAEVDNTPKGAALRIKQYLRSGVPEGFLDADWDEFYSTDLYEEVE